MQGRSEASTAVANKVPSWFRRNRWGLLAVIPALVALMYFYFDLAYEKYWEFQQKEPLTSVAGGQVRVLEFGHATDLKSFGDKPVTLPSGVAAWKAVLEFDSADPKWLEYCNLWLEDSAGRLYTDNPSELGKADVGFAKCEPEEGKSGPHQTTVYFVTSTTAEPAALRIVKSDLLPRFIRLPVSGV